MKNENFITIQGWMVNELNLKGNELILYAIIYGFSQDGRSKYYGSQRYIAKALKISLPTVNELIKKLLSKNLIIKKGESLYQAIQLDVKETLTGGVKETLTEVLKKVEQGVKETLTNKYNYNYNNNYISLPSARADLKFPLEDYNEVIKTYEGLKGVKFAGNEYKPIQQAIKSMFMSGRTKYQIIKCMEALNSSDLPHWQGWNINTVQKQIPLFVSGKLTF